MSKLLAVIIAALIFLLLFIGLAFAHEDAHWIETNLNAPDYSNNRYTTKAGIHCCGKDDCERIPQHVLDAMEPMEQLTDDGLPVGYWLYGQAFMRGTRSFYQSIDLSWWWCRSNSNNENVFCIFEPETGT